MSIENIQWSSIRPGEWTAYNCGIELDRALWDLRYHAKLQNVPLDRSLAVLADEMPAFRLTLAAQALQCARLARLGWLPTGFDMDIAHATNRRTF